MKFPYRSRTLFAATVVGAVALASGSHAAPGHVQATAIGKPGTAGPNTRTIEIKLGDMFFEPERISVRPGETVRFVISNTGKVLHEFNIGTAAMHAVHQKEMEAMAAQGVITDTGIDHAKMHGGHMGADGKPMMHDDPNAVLVPPGGKGEVVWTFPNATDLEFACNLPGHYDAGMVGRIGMTR